MNKQTFVKENCSPKEYGIMKMRHGWKDGVTRTLEEVGKEFGVTRERIRQIEAKINERIRISMLDDDKEGGDARF